MGPQNHSSTRALVTGLVAAVSLTLACGNDQAQENVGNQVGGQPESVLSTAPQQQPADAATPTTSGASQTQEPQLATPAFSATFQVGDADAATPTPSREDRIAALEERLGSLTIDRPDHMLLEISKSLPGWGGYVVGDDGKVHVYMPDAAAGENMKAQIATALSGVVQGYTIDHEGTTTEQRLSLTADDIVIEQDQFTMLQLLEWYWLTDFKPVLGGMDGTVAMGLGANGLRLDLEAEEHREAALAKAEQLGIPTEAVQISITGPLVLD